jgi:hypothetical protein
MYFGIPDRKGNVLRDYGREVQQFSFIKRAEAKE